MRVVLIDVVGSAETDRLAQYMTSRLTAQPFFDAVIRVRWSARRGEAVSHAESVDTLGRAMHLADAVVTLPWTAAVPVEALDDEWPERMKWLCEAVGESGVQTFVFGSSALGYSPGRTEQPVDETWPMTGLSAATAVRALADADRTVADFEQSRPVMRVVRLRPALVFEPGGAGTRPGRTTADERRLREQARDVQVLGHEDLARAWRLALTGSVSGPFNLAGPPVPVADLLGGGGHAERRLWRQLRPAPASPALAWLALAAESPLLDTTRAARELEFTAVAPTAHAVQGRRAAGRPVPAEAAPVSDFRARSLFGKAVDFFGACVRAVDRQEWGRRVWPGVTVTDLVAAAARDQHELTLRLRGCSEAEAEAALPADPLGVDRVDGWELAVEQVREALKDRSGDLPTAPLGQASPLGELLAESAAALAARGCCVAHSLERAPEADPELVEFLHQLVRTGRTPADVPPEILLEGLETAGTAGGQR